MDSKNRFETTTTHRLHRAEWGLALVVSLGAAAYHLDDIRWPLFVALFVVIDIVGYIPGAIVFHRSQTKQIPHRYFVMYNTMHSLTTWGLFALAWCAFVHPEWALLALPIHLMGDRSIFGNSMKNFAVPFEPETIPAFAALEQATGRGAAGGARPAAAPAGTRVPVGSGHGSR